MLDVTAKLFSEFCREREMGFLDVLRDSACFSRLYFVATSFNFLVFFYLQIFDASMF